MGKPKGIIFTSCSPAAFPSSAVTAQPQFTSHGSPRCEPVWRSLLAGNLWHVVHVRQQGSCLSLVNKCFLIENCKHCRNAEVVVALIVWMPNGVRQWCCFMSVFSTPCAFLTMLLLRNWFIHGSGFQYVYQLL